MTAADIVSSARIVMTAIVFMRSTSIPIVAENVRAWRIFRTKPGTMMAVGAASEAASFAGRQGLILRDASPTGVGDASQREVKALGITSGPHGEECGNAARLEP